MSHIKMRAGAASTQPATRSAKGTAARGIVPADRAAVADALGIGDLAQGAFGTDGDAFAGGVKDEDVVGLGARADGGPDRQAGGDGGRNAGDEGRLGVGDREVDEGFGAEVL